jgi:hypothetical protein
MRRYVQFTTIGITLALAIVVFNPDHSHAVAISLEPSPETVSLGDPVSVDIVISDLGSSGPASIGAFDLDVTFDTGVLSFVDYSLGFLLGYVDLFEAVDLSLREYAPGTVNVAELSLLTPSELSFLQLDALRWRH